MSEYILKHVYNACDPFKAASKEYYVDCSQARGDEALTHHFRRNLELSNRKLRFLMSGHIGCGKSSELACLQRALENPRPERGHQRYFTILMDADEYLDVRDVAPTDILLAIVAEVAASLREKAGIELKDNYFEKRFNEIKQLLLADVEPTEGEIPLWGGKVKIKLLQRDPEARQEVRHKLLPPASSILKEVNVLLVKAYVELQKKAVPSGEEPYRGIVLILDNLEKTERVEGKEEGEDSERELFIERAPQLTGLEAHVIYTVPLRLARSEHAGLKQRYDNAPFVLPMVKVARRGTREPYDKGIEYLRHLLEKRLGGHDLNDVFEPEALDFLLKYSGGHLRNLLLSVREACAYADTAPIPLRAAQRAIQQTVRGYSTGIPEAHWDLLAKLDASEDQQIPADDDRYLRMLEDLSVLEYINGEAEADMFESAAPWYAVNPVVRELPKFKAATKRLAASSQNE